MKIVIVSTFWNSERYITDCINSLKSQNYTDFVAYFIDDMSIDNSYNVAKDLVEGDERFILIRNTEKKYKTKNFIDVIRDNKKIQWDDVILELDGDDKLSDNFVLGLVNKIYSDENIWICGSKWVDKDNRKMNYGKSDPENARRTSWNFSHMRTFRAFLFRLIKDEDLKYDDEYFKAACDLGHGIPMLEMSGTEHYYFLDKVTYIYIWHENQTFTDNNSFGDSTLQKKIAKHIYSLPQYSKLNIISNNFGNLIPNTITKSQVVNNLLNKVMIGEEKPKKHIILESINAKPKEQKQQITYHKTQEVINNVNVKNNIVQFISQPNVTKKTIENKDEINKKRKIIGDIK